MRTASGTEPGPDSPGPRSATGETGDARGDITLDAVAAVVRGYRFTYATEAQLHDGIEAALRGAGWDPAREVRIAGAVKASAGRIDLVVGRIGVEVKIQGGVNDVAHQLQRYLESPDLDGVVLVTGKVGHLGLAHPRLFVVSLTSAL